MADPGDALAKLESFDADLRFMGLSDIQALLVASPNRSGHDGLDTLGTIRDAVIKRLDDPITEVQNQAVRTLGSLVAASSSRPEAVATIVRAVVARECGESVTALALRSLIDHTPLELAGIFSTCSVPNLTKLDSIDELDVLVDLLRRFGGRLPSSQVWSAVCVIVDLLSEGGSLSGLEKLRSLEALRLGLPLALAAFPARWPHVIHFFAQQTEQLSSSVGALQLTSWICEAPETPVDFLDHLWEAVSPRILKDVFEVSEDTVTQTEASLMAMEAFARYSNVGAAKGPQAVAVASRLLHFNPGQVPMNGDGNNSNGPGDYDYDDYGGFEDEEDDDSWSDDSDSSFRVRQLAARLAGTLRSPELLGLIVSALHTERDLNVRSQLLKAAALFPQTRVSDVWDVVRTNVDGGGLELLVTLVSRETAQMSTTDTECSQLLALAKDASSKRSLVMPALQLVRALGHSAADDAATAVVQHAFSFDDHAVQMQALEAAQSLGNPIFTTEALRLANRAGDSVLRQRAVRVAAKLASPRLAGEVLAQQTRMLRQDPSSRALVAQALASLLARLGPSLPEQNVSDAVAAVGEVLDLKPSSPVVAACYQVLEEAPLNAAVVRACLAGPLDPELQARVLKRPPISDQAAEWLLSLPLLSQVSEGSVLALAHDAVQAGVLSVDAVRAAGASSELVAAAVSGWAEAMKVDTVDLDVGTDVALVAALAIRGLRTLSIAQLVEISRYTAGSVALALANVALLSETDFQALVDSESSLDGEIWATALELVAAKQPQWKERLWQVVKTSATTNESLSRVSAWLVAHDNSANGLTQLPSTVALESAKLALPLVQSKELFAELLGEWVIALEHQHPAQAPFTVAWAVQNVLVTKFPDAPVDLDHIVAGVTACTQARNPAKIRTVQMGPFALKVDDNAPLRQAGFEALYMLLSSIPEHVGPRREVIEAVVAGLRDTEHQIKVLACHVAGELSTASPSAVLDEFLPVIEAAFETELGRQVKETTVKQEHDRHAALVRAVTDAKKRLFT